MINVIKMESNRMIKSKLFLVMLIIFGIMTTGSVFLSRNTQSSNINNQHEVKVEIEKNNTKTLGNIVNGELVDGDILILIGIAASIFVTSESKSGFIKNSSISVKKRWHLTFAKSVSVGILIILFFIENIFINTVLGKILIPGFELNFSTNFFAMIFCAFLLMMAYSSLIIAIAVISKKNSIGIVSSCFIGVGGVSGIVTFIERIMGINNFGKKRYKVGNV